ncbi:hypothetical protein NLJ89_g3053 [Agrocybe chaxingu]|uniref:Wax synthase domain-containing protein n=1 Tax=Agrocybe chaxingu TaxID=84603 RepID=A0A9W8K5M9_9AGAR|nr:hypothetical protein NLJ89_g3053 [Agrocybe chaxingu]
MPNYVWRQIHAINVGLILFDEKYIDTFETTQSRFILFLATLVLSLALKPSPIRSVIFYLVCAVYASIVLIPSPIPLDATIQYHFGLIGALYLSRACYLVFFTESPLQELRQKGQKTTATEFDLVSRLRWSLNLILNPRGANWSCEVRGLRRSAHPHWAFVWSQLKWAAAFFLLRDALEFWVQRNNAFGRFDEHWMDAQWIIWRAFNGVLFWFSMYALMQSNHALCAAVAVSLGISDPSDWPAWFGPLDETVTVRKFWGQTWHQAIRMGVATHAQYFTNTILGFPKGTSRSSYTQLYTAFFISGLIHAFGDFAVTHDIKPFADNMVCYCIQAIAITFEDVAIIVFKGLGIHRVPRVVGSDSTIWTEVFFNEKAARGS